MHPIRFEYGIEYQSHHAEIDGIRISGLLRERLSTEFGETVEVSPALAYDGEPSLSATWTQQVEDDRNIRVVYDLSGEAYERIGAVCDAIAGELDINVDPAFERMVKSDGHVVDRDGLNGLLRQMVDIDAVVEHVVDAGGDLSWYRLVNHEAATQESFRSGHLVALHFGQDESSPMLDPQRACRFYLLRTPDGLPLATAKIHVMDAPSKENLVCGPYMSDALADRIREISVLCEKIGVPVSALTRSGSERTLAEVVADMPSEIERYAAHIPETQLAPS